MPRKIVPVETRQFSITLPAPAMDMIKQLLQLGLHGASRGEVVRGLVLAQLTFLLGKNIVQTRSSRATSKRARKSKR